MSCGTQVEAKEWFLRSNKGIIALRQAEHQMPWPTDHKPMRTRWVTFHEQKWVRSRERRGLFPSIPFHRLAEAHELIRQKLGFVQPGYVRWNVGFVRSLGRRE